MPNDDEKYAHISLPVVKPTKSSFISDQHLILCHPNESMGDTKVVFQPTTPLAAVMDSHLEAGLMCEKILESA